jgi:hypothetical protein
MTQYWRTDPRYEIKMHLDARPLSEVQAWVRVHPAHLHREHPVRQVNNVYFDTYEYQGLNANLSGVAERAKLRLRWYGLDAGPITGARLELKRKQGKVGWKEISAVEGDLDLGSAWSALCCELRGRIAPQARLWLDRFAYPVLLNRYRRAYYVTADGIVRLTLDDDLRAYDQRLSPRPNLTHVAPRRPSVTVELKAATDPDAVRRLSDVLAHFPARVGRFSKYVQGMLTAEM